MLFKWRERKGPEATYLALIQIFQKTNDEKVIDLIIEYVEKGRNCESEGLKFPKLNTERIDASEFEKNITKLEKSLHTSVIGLPYH